MSSYLDKILTKEESSLFSVSKNYWKQPLMLAVTKVSNDIMNFTVNEKIRFGDNGMANQIAEQPLLAIAGISGILAKTEEQFFLLVKDAIISAKIHGNQNWGFLKQEGVYENIKMNLAILEKRLYLDIDLHTQNVTNKILQEYNEQKFDRFDIRLRYTLVISESKRNVISKFKFAIENPDKPEEKDIEQSLL